MNFSKIRLFVFALAVSFFIGFIMGMIFVALTQFSMVGMILTAFIILLAIFTILTLIVAIIYSGKFLELLR